MYGFELASWPWRTATQMPARKNTYIQISREPSYFGKIDSRISKVRNVSHILWKYEISCTEESNSFWFRWQRCSADSQNWYHTFRASTCSKSALVHVKCLICVFRARRQTSLEYRGTSSKLYMGSFFLIVKRAQSTTSQFSLSNTFKSNVHGRGFRLIASKFAV